MLTCQSDFFWSGVHMVRLYHDLNSLSFSKLADVYEESNRNNADRRYPEIDRNAAYLCAEQDFYGFLSEVFYRTEGAYYAVLEEQGSYCSAVRVEPYQDGFLLSGLETAPKCRRKGYGTALISEVLSSVGYPVYSHVEKDNIPSLNLHKACGFTIVQNDAIYLDGTKTDAAYTMRYWLSNSEIDIDK